MKVIIVWAVVVDEWTSSLITIGLVLVAVICDETYGVVAMNVVVIMLWQ